MKIAELPPQCGALLPPAPNRAAPAASFEDHLGAAGTQGADAPGVNGCGTRPRPGASRDKPSAENRGDTPGVGKAAGNAKPRGKKGGTGEDGDLQEADQTTGDVSAKPQAEDSPRRAAQRGEKKTDEDGADTDVVSAKDKKGKEVEAEPDADAAAEAAVVAGNAALNAKPVNADTEAGAGEGAASLAVAAATPAGASAATAAATQGAGAGLSNKMVAAESAPSKSAVNVSGAAKVDASETEGGAIADPSAKPTGAGGPVISEKDKPKDGTTKAKADATASSLKASAAANKPFEVEAQSASKPAELPLPPGAEPAVRAAGDAQGAARPPRLSPLPIPEPPENTPDPNVARVARGLQNAIAQRGGSVTLRLQPPELGLVRIELAVANGAASVRFQADDESVRSLLSHQMSSLRHALERHGLSVERMDVQQAPASASPDRQGDGSPWNGQDNGRSRGQFFSRQQQPSGGGSAPSQFNASEQPESFAQALVNTVA